MMGKNNKQVLNILHIVAWIAFIGICIKAGAVILSVNISFFVNPQASANLYRGLDLSALFRFNERYYAAMASYVILIFLLQASIFYWLIKIAKTINLQHPFSIEVGKYIKRISAITLAIGIICYIAQAQAHWLENRCIAMPELRNHIGGAAEFILMAGILFFIAQVFDRGIELQSDNALTV